MTLQINTTTGARDLTTDEQAEARTGLAAAAAADLTAHTGNTTNPHGVTKSQVGLGNADNTADADKPVSTAQATAIGAAVTAHTDATDPHPQYLTPADADALYAPIGSGGGGGATNLAAIASPAGVTITSDTGTDATIAGADGTNAGAMLPAQVTKLAGIATGATANATDAQLRDRATHTGAQAISTVTGLQTALDGKATAAQGAKADAALPATADAIADVLEAAATGAPADLARIQASVSGGLGAIVPHGAKVVIEGDSRMAACGDLSHPTWSKLYPFGPLQWAAARLGVFWQTTVPAVSGAKTQDVRNRIANTVWATNPHMMIYMCDVNDIATNVPEATTLANHEYIIKGTLDRGIKVVACLSSTYSTITDAQRRKAIGYHRKLKDLCQRNGAFVADVYGAMCDPATGYMLPGMSTDGTHYTYLGAYTAGSAIYQALIGRVQCAPIPLFTGDLRAQWGESKNHATNPVCALTTGNRVDGWSFPGLPATITSVESIVGADGYSGAGKMQRVAYTATGAGMATVYKATSAALMTAGANVSAAVCYRMSGMSGAVSGVAFNFYSVGAGAQDRGASWGYRFSDHGNMLVPDHSGVAVIPPAMLDAATGNVYLQVDVEFLGAGAATVDFGPIFVGQW